MLSFSTIATLGTAVSTEIQNWSLLFSVTTQHSIVDCLHFVETTSLYIYNRLKFSNSEGQNPVETSAIVY
jgi:hypothetical protein